jgi:hypothetical protein
MRSRVVTYLYNNDAFSAHVDKYLQGRSCDECKDGCWCGAPDEWLDAAAMEAYTAFTETLDTWVETLIAGRPYDTPLVEWEHRELKAEHQDCIPWDDAKEVAQQ